MPIEHLAEIGRQREQHVRSANQTIGEEVAGRLERDFQIDDNLKSGYGLEW
jgi:hypothetical protein